MIKKPMLAGKSDGKPLATLQFPLLATPKLDGIRCLLVGGKALSRKFLPIPNNHIRNAIESIKLPTAGDALDGEIMVDGRTFNELSGDVRRIEGTPDFKYMVFDYVNGDFGFDYDTRVRQLELTLAPLLPDFVKLVLPVPVKTVDELMEYEANVVAQGYEGVMVRTPSSPYKQGRSSWNEGYLIKIKRFEDDEATIVGYEEEMQNNNVAEQDAFGRTKRSSCQDNLVGKNTLGKLVCTAPKWKKEFSIGTGFTAELRKELWADRDALLGRLVKFKHQPSGADERPRFPVFLGFRDEWDT